MSNESTNPAIKWILIAIIGVSFLVAVFFFLIATYPANEYSVARELKSRGFGIDYTARYNMVWQHPTSVWGHDQKITPDDFRLICQLPRLAGLDFLRCDASGLNLDEIGNCKKLFSIQFSVTQFPTNEIPKLAACRVVNLALKDIHFNDSDLDHLAGLTKLMFLDLQENPGITDASFEYFEKIPYLKVLFLSKTSVTKEGGAEFRKKRPDVEVYFECPLTGVEMSICNRPLKTKPAP